MGIFAFCRDYSNMCLQECIEKLVYIRDGIKQVKKWSCEFLCWSSVEIRFIAIWPSTLLSRRMVIVFCGSSAVNSFASICNS